MDRGVPPKPKSKRPQVPGWRKWLYRLLSATVIPSLFFLLLEGSLRVCGFGDPSGFFVKIEGRDAHTTNPHFGWRFFPPSMARTPVVCELPAKKKEGTYRIFVLGGSAAQGIPASAFSFGRMLRAMLAVVHNALGTLLIQQGQLEEAIRHFRHALEIDPNIPAPRANLAIILTKQGDFPEAVEHCRELLRIEPDGAEVVWIMEQVCRQKGDKNPVFLDTLALAYAQAGQCEEAIATASRALQLAESQGDRSLAQNIRRSLSLYKQTKRFLEASI